MVVHTKFGDDWTIFDLDTAFWNSRLEYFKMQKMLCIQEKSSDLHQNWCEKSYLRYWHTPQKWKKSIRKYARKVSTSKISRNWNCSCSLSKLQFLTDFVIALSVDHYYSEEDPYWILWWLGQFWLRFSILNFQTCKSEKP